MAFRPARIWPFEQQTVDRAAYFTACAFRGRCIYDVVEAPTQEAALIEAAKLYQDRDVAIYAVDHHGHQAMIGAYIP